MSGEVERFLESFGDVKQAFDKVLNQATQDAQTPADLHRVAQAYRDYGSASMAQALRIKIGDAVKARVDQAGVIEDVAYLAAALRLLD